jgi:hypothetical protein
MTPFFFGGDFSKVFVNPSVSLYQNVALSCCLPSCRAGTDLSQSSYTSCYITRRLEVGVVFQQLPPRSIPTKLTFTLVPNLLN